MWLPFVWAVVLVAVLVSATLIVLITGSTDGLSALGGLVVATLGVSAAHGRPPRP